MKSTILFIMNHYLPGTRTGGPVRTTSNIISWLGDEFDFRVLTKNHDAGDLTVYPNTVTGKWNSVGKAQVRYLGADEQHLWSMCRILNNTHYDILYLDSVLAEFTLKVLLLRKMRLLPNKPIIIAPRGHLNCGALQIKPTKKHLFLKAAKFLLLYEDIYWHASNEEEKIDILREIQPRHSANIWTISNLPTRSLAEQLKSSAPKVRGQARLLFFSRISRKKNLHFALELLYQIEGKIELDIYGQIEDYTYWQYCLSIVEQLPTDIRVDYKGIAPFENVAELFAGYHLMILPTLGENFGHVILESLSAGCPVLISDQTPWKDVRSQKVGWDVSLISPDEFRSVLREIVDMDTEDFVAISKRAQQYGTRYTKNSDLIEQTKHFFKEILNQ